MIELDPNYDGPVTATLQRVDPNGERTAVLSKATDGWGRYLRYDYRKFDFTAVREPGLYLIEFAGVESEPFRIDSDVYRGNVW